MNKSFNKESKKIESKKMDPKKRNEIIKTVLFIVIVIAASFLFVPILKSTLNTQYPLVVVTSGSMEPTIYKGDILIIEGKEPADIMPGDHDNRTGDILLYDSSGLGWSWNVNEPIVHRVVGKYYNDTDNMYYFIVHGDNNSDTDPPGSPSNEIPVPEDHVLGVVKFKIPKVGYVKIFLSKFSGLSTVLIIGLSVLLITSIVKDILNPDEEEEVDKKNLHNNEKNDLNSDNSYDLGV